MSDPIAPEPQPPRQKVVRLRDLVLVMLVCGASQIAVLLAAVLIVDVRAVFAGLPVPKNPQMPAAAIFLAGLTDAGLGVLGAWVFACLRPGLSFADGLRAHLPAPRELRWAALAGLGCVAAEIALVAVSPGNGDEAINALTSTTGGVVAFALLGLISPFAEEIYYRGFMFLALENRFGTWPSAIVVTLWFAALHGPQYWPNIGAIASIGVLSATATALRVRTGSIVPSIAAHFAYNFTLVVLAAIGALTGVAK